MDKIKVSLLIMKMRLKAYSFFCLLFLASFSLISQCDDVPALNKEILLFVKTNLHKKVDRGECWDLAAQALNKTGAKWNGKYQFGKEVNYKKDCVYPGDIIQFKDVVLKYKSGEQYFTEKMLHHTAIVYEVKGKGKFIIADQNTRHSGKKVGTHEFDLEDLVKGSIIIYRPEK